VTFAGGEWSPDTPLGAGCTPTPCEVQPLWDAPNHGSIKGRNPKILKNIILF
jgi:hypothetical protein